MFGARISWLRHSKRFFNHHHRRRLCNSTTHNSNKQQSSNISNNNGEKNIKVNDIRELEGYRDLDNLDFMKAAKILFSAPQKKKKFGLDFHLVQLFFALMPSLAVYLVAQYARYDIRKMEAEAELKKKAEEEQKAKEMEAAVEEEEKEAESANPELLKVKERLEALEETLKEIVVETKKQPSKGQSKSAGQQEERVDPNSRSDASLNAAKSQPKTEEVTSGESQKQHDSEKKGSQEDEKK